MHACLFNLKHRPTVVCVSGFDNLFSRSKPNTMTGVICFTIQINYKHLIYSFLILHKKKRKINMTKHKAKTRQNKKNKRDETPTGTRDTQNGKTTPEHVAA